MTTRPGTVPRHACARCGKQQPAERMTYSRFTRNRYCLGFSACDKRAKRKDQR